MPCYAMDFVAVLQLCRRYIDLLCKRYIPMKIKCRVMLPTIQCDDCLPTCVTGIVPKAKSITFFWFRIHLSETKHINDQRLVEISGGQARREWWLCSDYKGDYDRTIRVTMIGL